FDPLRESEPHMRKICADLNGTYFNVALGERKDVLKISARPELGGSTLFEEVGSYVAKGSYDVPVERFDSLVRTFEIPALCKIDVQGAELAVLKGMGTLLNSIDCFIIEVSLIETLRGIPLIGEIFDYMSERDFLPYDVLSLGRRPLDGALAQTD